MVYGVGEHFEQLAKLEKLFRLPRLATLDNDDDYACGWTIPSPGSYVAAVQSPQFDVPQDVDPLDLPATATAQPEPPSPAPFIYRRVGTGCLAAMSPANPFPGKPLDWNWFFKAIPENHWKWSKRTGLSLSRPNGDYWKMLVPGVGRAPVKSFIVLVSIFALVIGPLNYLLLARARRLYLLLLTVPLGATLVTMGLFGFALAADGLGTRLRIRSYAELDQETGRVSVLSWQSYYAGVSPSSGLQFPDDSTVFPLLANPNASSSDRSTLLTWDRGQILRSGYLPSRSPTQFVVARATPTRARLAVKENADDTSPPQVENLLGAKMKYLVVRAASDKLYVGKEIANGAKVKLTETELPAIQSDLVTITNAVAPTEPDGYELDFQNDNLLSVFGIRRWRYSADAGIGEMNLSLLETSLASATNVSQTWQILPGNYLAILERSPMVVTGVGAANEQQSLHVLRGRY